MENSRDQKCEFTWKEAYHNTYAINEVKIHGKDIPRVDMIDLSHEKSLTIITSCLSIVIKKKNDIGRERVPNEGQANQPIQQTWRMNQNNLWC